jgi:hypothetical protein
VYASPSPAPGVRGSTAMTTAHDRHPHLIGSSLRAIGVYVETAFRVTVLGPECVRH